MNVALAGLNQTDVAQNGLYHTTGEYDDSLGTYTYDQSAPSTLLELVQRKCSYAYIKQLPKHLMSCSERW